MTDKRNSSSVGLDLGRNGYEVVLLDNKTEVDFTEEDVYLVYELMEILLRAGFEVVYSDIVCARTTDGYLNLEYTGSLNVGDGTVSLDTLIGCAESVERLHFLTDRLGLIVPKVVVI